MNRFYRFTYKVEGAVVDPIKIKEIEKFFEDDDAFENGNQLGFQNVEFAVKKDKIEHTSKLIKIELSTDVYNPRGDYIYNQFLDAKLFALKLSEALISGSIKLYFSNDDMTDTWGLRIEPKTVYMLYPDWKIDKEIKITDLSKKELLKSTK
jgi:hypothetical protein